MSYLVKMTNDDWNIVRMKGIKGAIYQLLLKLFFFINFVNLAIENVSCTLFITIQDRSLADAAGFIRNEFQKSGSN